MEDGDLLLLKSLKDYFSGHIPVRDWSMLASKRSKKKMFINGIRQHFQVPKHIPYEQFDKYLREVERRLKCRLNKT